MRRCLALVGLFASSLLAQPQPFDAAAMMQLARLSDPQISPDGKTVAFVSQTIDVTANKKPKEIYTVPLSGGPPRSLGEGDRPRWLRDSHYLVFTGTRGGASQIWMMNEDGVDAHAITSLATEADGAIISPDSKYIVFTSAVYPDCGADDACNAQHIAAEKDQPKARIYNSLLYRHWTDWQSARRTHLLSMPVSGGKTVDLTPGAIDVPPFSLGGPDDYVISPDSQEVCYVENTADVPAISTNTDLFVVRIEGGEARRITTNPAADMSPRYSPDGRYIAYRSQTRPGYESDRFTLLLLERTTGKVTVLTDLLDRWVNSFVWSPDSQRIFFTAMDRGRQPIQFLEIAGGGTRVAVSGESVLDDMQFTPDGKTLVFTRQSGASPVEIVRAASSGGAPQVLTHFNDAVLAAHPTAPLEELWTKGAEDAQVQSFLVKPPNFNAAKKYPVLLLIHGGPQGEWAQSWTYRWNAQVFAGAGYVVVMPNPRGSVGYGQKFIDDINGDWGGRAYADVMAVADRVAALPYVDKDRMAAAGGSYGGYMVDWILGHTNRFKALIAHAGVYDLRSEAGATEELWFPKWEFAGMPWENPEMYDRWSPSHFAREFKTPTLVIHGELDFRVPYTQGLELFTALQLQKVPSRLLIYPDEGHFILKPQNSMLWYKTFIDWIDTWTKK
ncbi:MAG TPA: S9 family peptidase [Solibacterales bacterium]|jgi:dipeptidyl aminopeptidase/acylaminoacyl peptidase|nr:S9 family peptidase [Bryobacterales bacterium]